MIIRNATSASYYGSGLHDEPCKVRLSDKQLDIICIDPGGREVIWYGDEIAPGHYRLDNREGGTGTLHCFPNSRFLDGWWQENGEEGMWRITLSS